MYLASSRGFYLVVFYSGRASILRTVIDIERLKYYICISGCTAEPHARIIHGQLSEYRHILGTLFGAFCSTKA